MAEAEIDTRAAAVSSRTTNAYMRAFIYSRYLRAQSRARKNMTLAILVYATVYLLSRKESCKVRLYRVAGAHGVPTRLSTYRDNGIGGTARTLG